MLEYVTYFPWSVPFSQQGMNRLSIYKVSVPYHRGTSHPKILLMYTIRDVFILFLGMFHCLHSPLLWELSRFVGSACREWQWPATARNWPPFCSPSGVQWHWKDASGGRRPCRARFPGASHNCKNTHTHAHTETRSSTFVTRTFKTGLPRQLSYCASRFPHYFITPSKTSSLWCITNFRGTHLSACPRGSTEKKGELRRSFRSRIHGT